MCRSSVYGLYLVSLKDLFALDITNDLHLFLPAPWTCDNSITRALKAHSWDRSLSGPIPHKSQGSSRIGHLPGFQSPQVPIQSTTHGMQSDSWRAHPPKHSIQRIHCQHFHARHHKIPLEVLSHAPIQGYPGSKGHLHNTGHNVLCCNSMVGPWNGLASQPGCTSLVTLYRISIREYVSECVHIMADWCMFFKFAFI